MQANGRKREKDVKTQKIQSKKREKLVFVASGEARVAAAGSSTPSFLIAVFAAAGPKKYNRTRSRENMVEEAENVTPTGVRPVFLACPPPARPPPAATGVSRRKPGHFLGQSNTDRAILRPYRQDRQKISLVKLKHVCHSMVLKKMSNR